MTPLSCCTGLKKWVTLLTTTLLAGCASLSPDHGFDQVNALSKERQNKNLIWQHSAQESKRIDDIVKEHLAKPLSVEDAVQVALLKNLGLQATYFELGIGDADRVQAARLPNPGISFMRLGSVEGVKIERTFLLDFIRVLTLPLAQSIETQRFERTKLIVTNQVFRIADETRKAYFMAIAAQETVHYLQQVKTSAEAGAELAQQMRKVGNWSTLDQMREQAFYADATAQLSRAQTRAITEREKLSRLLGLSEHKTAFQLPERLPDLPKNRLDLHDLESFAITQRLDIQIAQLETTQLAASLGLTRRTRLLNVLELGYKRNSETNGLRETGYEIRLEIPLFDWGEARIAKAEALYMQSVQHLAETALQARSEVREAYANYHSTYDLAKHYHDEVVPLRKKISAEYLLRYNGMLSSVFELLADSREQVMSVMAYMETLKDFWNADAELHRVLGGRLPESTSPAAK